MNTYTIQIRTETRPGVFEWRDMRPTRSTEPYRFGTYAAAEAARRVCYPDQTEDQVRVNPPAPTEAPALKGGAA